MADFYMKSPPPPHMHEQVISFLEDRQGKIMTGPPAFFNPDFRLTVTGDWSAVFESCLSYREYIGNPGGDTFEVIGASALWEAIGTKLHGGDPNMNFRFEYTLDDQDILLRNDWKYKDVIVSTWYEFFDYILSYTLDDTYKTGGRVNSEYLQSELNKWNDKTSSHTLSELTLGMSNELTSPVPLNTNINANTYFWAEFARKSAELKGQDAFGDPFFISIDDFITLVIQYRADNNNEFHGSARLAAMAIKLSQNDSIVIPMNFHDANNTRNVHAYIVLKQN